MKIALGTDHAGFALKEHLKVFLTSLGHDVADMGAHAHDANDDYPDFIAPVAHAVAQGDAERGIIFGGSGQGEAMVANRTLGVRAAVCYSDSEDIVRLSREHNDANILSFGARFVTPKVAERLVQLWLATPFSGERRHARRITKLDTQK